MSSPPLTWITFVGQTPQEAYLRDVTVTLWDEEGTLVLQDVFSHGVPVGPVAHTIVPLLPGEYKLAARSNGYSYEAFQTIEVPTQEEEETSANVPKIYFLQATPSAQVGGQLPCRVSGYVDLPSPNSAPGYKVLGFAVPVRSGTGTVLDSQVYGVTFERVEPTRAGEGHSLLPKEKTRVVFDKNGYFEAYLHPEALYRIWMPNVQGVRYIRTPESGESASVETLIEELQSTPIYEL